MNQLAILIASLFLTTSCTNSENATNVKGTQSPNPTSTVQTVTCDPLRTPFGGGSGTESYPYLICSSDHLLNIDSKKEYLKASFRLEVDLDLDGVAMTQIDGQFEGTFFGNNKTISKFKSFDHAFFEILSGKGVVENLHLKDLSVTAFNAAGLVGSVEKGGKVKNCSVSGVVVGRVTTDGSGTISGGLVGTNQGEISDSRSSASVTSPLILGGLVGWNLGTIIHSSAVGIVTSVSTSCGAVIGGLALLPVGGLVGQSTSGLISKSYSAGEVRSTINCALWGLAGSSNGTVSNSYSTTQGATAMIGTGSGVISRCFSVFPLVGNSWINRSFTVTDSYWDIEASGISDSWGTGKTTNEMKDINTFFGWDSSVTWSFNSGSYPTLK